MSFSVESSRTSRKNQDTSAIDESMYTFSIEFYMILVATIKAIRLAINIISCSSWTRRVGPYIKTILPNWDPTK